MNLAQTISLQAVGNQNSGCHGPNCGRPAGHSGPHIPKKQPRYFGNSRKRVGPCGTYLQTGPTCAPTALANIAQAFGVKMDPHQLAEMMGTESGGTSMFTMVSTAHYMKFPLQPMNNVSVNDFHKIPTPYLAIVSVAESGTPDHVFIINDANNEHAHVIDSGVTNVSKIIDKEQLSRIWTGIIMVPQKEEQK